MLDLEQIKKELKTRNLAAVARELNIGYMTMYNISNGKTPNPSYRVVKKLSDFLE